MSARTLATVALPGLLLVLAGPGRAADQCTPFDIDQANSGVKQGRLPDGGFAPDDVVCCKQGVACQRRCQPKAQVSQPVDTISGFAWLDRTDLRATQPWGPAFLFARHYSTAMAERAAGTSLGPGWSHTYSSALAVTLPGPAARVRLDDQDNGGEEYNLVPGGAYASQRAGRTLAWDGALHLYLARRDDGSLLVFDEAGRLTLVRAADGGEAQLRYGGEVACPASATVPQGALCRVDFLFGRQLFFSYDASARLAWVAHDVAGATRVVSLAYDASGRLATATGADGQPETYAYGFDHQSWAAGVPVSLLLSATDADGTVVESFGYAFNHDATDGPARVVAHQTPEASYTFSWDYLSANNQVVRKTRVRGTAENLDLTFKDGALASVCPVDAQGNCDLTQLQEFVLAPGLLDDLCERESSGFYLRHERDARGRVVAEYRGLASCDGVTPEARRHGETLGYLGDTAIRTSTSFPTVDATAPAGFEAFTVSDYTLPGAQVDARCGTAACLTPSAYNQGPLGTALQREVRVGRTLLDTDGTWGTQVQVTAWTYDGSGRRVSVDGPRTDVPDLSTWTWSPTLPWAMTSFTLAGHGPVRYADHDLLGRPHTVTDEAGQVEHRDHDARGRLLSRLEPGLSSPTTWAYTPSGREAAVTEPGGASERYEYTQGRLTAARRYPAEGASTADSSRTFSYLGERLTGETALVGLLPARSLGYAYDAQGRLTATQPGGPTNGRAVGLDGDGRLGWRSDRGAYDGTANPPRSHRYTYDPYGGLATVERLLQGTWVTLERFTRDARGWPTSVTDARGVTTTFVHDDFGQLVELSSPDLGLRRYVHDEAGNVVQERRGDGTVLTYRYDAADRLVAVLQGGAVLETREVAAAAPAVTDCASGAALPAPGGTGQVTHVSDATGEWYFGFWPHGETRYEARVAPGATCARTLWWEYDAAGRLTAEVYPSGARVELGYPAAGQPFPDLASSLTLVAGGQRTPLLTQLTYVEGELTAYTTPAGRWSLSRNLDGTPTLVSALSGGLREQRFSGLDAWGNPGAIQEKVAGEETPALLQTVSHDGLPALTGSAGPGQAARRFASLATHDRKSADGVPYCYETGTHRLARVGEARAFRYDPSGAAWQEQRGDGSLRTWCHGPRGELAQAVGAGGELSRLLTNFRGQRTTERWPLAGLQEDFRVDTRGRLRVEAGVASLQALYPRPVREYVWVGSHPVAVLESTEAADGSVTRSGVTFVFSGQLGEVLAEADPSGQVLRQYALSPYGERSELPPPSAEQAVSVQLLASPPFDGLSGLVQVRAGRALRLRFTDAAWSGCHVTARDASGMGSAWLGEWSAVVPGTLTDWLPAAEALLTVTGCSPPGRVMVGLQPDPGLVELQARSETTAHPYPPAGQQFHLSLPAPGYVHFTGVALASCDRLEARGPSGQVLWAWTPSGFSIGGFVVPDTEGWSARLQGEVDVGVWGAGCNTSAAGFSIAELRLEVPPAGLRPPVAITLPGQKLRADGTVDNWHRLYLPELGRYLQPEPLAALSPARAAAGPIYAYALETPLRVTDPTGLFAQVSAATCSGWKTALKNAKAAAGCDDKATRSCKCQDKLKECGSCDLCELLSSDHRLKTHIVDNLTCAGEPAGGCSTITELKHQDGSSTFRNEKVEFNSTLCSSEPEVTDNLSRAMLHEAVHLCAPASGHRFPDKSRSCSPDAIADACFPQPRPPDDGLSFLNP